MIIRRGILGNRHAELLAGDATQPEAWWYLSFGSLEKGFLGGIVVRARGFATALQIATDLQMNPGGEVKGYAMLEEDLKSMPINKLMSKAELEQYSGGAERF